MALTDINSAENVGLDKRDKHEIQSSKPKTTAQSLEFSKYLGHYKKIPELQSVIDRLALWVVYGGDDTDEENKDISFKKSSDRKKFEKITGFGKDTPEEVFCNIFRMGKIGGTSTAEIIRKRRLKKGIINVKPLDPETIKVKANEKGIITGFEQVAVKSGEDGKQEKLQDFKLDDIFYIAWNRIADEIVGISTIEKLEPIIEKRHQAMDDLAEVFHRYVVPFWMFYVDTDDEDEIQDFKEKVKKMVQDKDHMVVPKDAVESAEKLAVPEFATLDPLNWIKHLERYFLISEGVPELISGIGRETADAASRMIYLSWRIITIANQKIFEKHIKSQLGIDMTFPRPVNILAPEITEDRTEVARPKPKNKEGENGNTDS